MLTHAITYVCKLTQTPTHANSHQHLRMQTHTNTNSRKLTPTPPHANSHQRLLTQTDTNSSSRKLTPTPTHANSHQHLLTQISHHHLRMLTHDITYVCKHTRTPTHANSHQHIFFLLLADRSRGRPEGSLFVSFYQLVGEGATPFPCVSTI